jgi:hypothetical protein
VRFWQRASRASWILAESRFHTAVFLLACDAAARIVVEGAVAILDFSESGEIPEELEFFPADQITSHAYI